MCSRFCRRGLPRIAEVDADDDDSDDDDGENGDDGKNDDNPTSENLGLSSTFIFKEFL